MSDSALYPMISIFSFFIHVTSSGFVWDQIVKSFFNYAHSLYALFLFVYFYFSAVQIQTSDLYLDCSGSKFEENLAPHIHP